jgi:hypothetical protein
MIDAASVPVSWCPGVADGVVALPVDDHLVLWGPAVRVPELLAPVEAAVWSFLDGSTSVQELADDLADVFHAPGEQALADARGLVARWAELGLVLDDLDLGGRAGDVHQGTRRPLSGPDADEHPLQSPAVPPNAAVAELVRWHAPVKCSVRADRLRFGVSVEATDHADPAGELATRLADVLIDDDTRRRYALLRERRDDDPRWLVLSDVGLPLHRTVDVHDAVAAVSRLVSDLVDRQRAADVAWFRLAVAERDDEAVLLQHELLYAYPSLAAGLEARRFVLRAADGVAVDRDGRVVRFADRFADPDRDPDTPRVEARHRVRGIVLVGGPEVGPTPVSEPERRWLLALHACIGHEPRCDPWDLRWDVTGALLDAPMQVIDSFTPEAVLAAVDRS